MVSLELATVPFKVVPSSEIYNSAEIQPNGTVYFRQICPLRVSSGAPRDNLEGVVPAAALKNIP